MTRHPISHVTRLSEGSGLRRRRNTYDQKCIAIARGENPVLFPADFVQLLLDKQSISSADFDVILGHAKDSDYFRSDVFNTGYNDGGRLLPRPMREKLAALTGTSDLFWKRYRFTASDAENVTIDPTVDISTLIEKYKNAGGRTTKALQRDELLDAHMKGL
jgi:hypothetical protein